VTAEKCGPNPPPGPVEHTGSQAGSPAGVDAGADPGPDPAAESLEGRLRRLPREVGVLLVTIGVLGIALPGLAGTPALIAGGLMLWPRGFRSVNTWLARRCPTAHRHGVEQLFRYLEDMERRYPTGR